MLADQVFAQDSRGGNWIHASILIFYEGQLAQGLSHALQMSHLWWASRVLAWVGEYDEARRIYPDGSHWVDAEEGDWDGAIHETKEQLKIAPDSIDALTIAGSSSKTSTPRSRPPSRALSLFVLKKTIFLFRQDKQDGQNNCISNYNIGYKFSYNFIFIIYGNRFL